MKIIINDKEFSFIESKAGTFELAGPIEIFKDLEASSLESALKTAIEPVIGEKELNELVFLVSQNQIKITIQNPQIRATFYENFIADNENLEMNEHTNTNNNANSLKPIYQNTVTFAALAPYQPNSTDPNLRFEAFADTYHSAVITGNNRLNKKDKQDEASLDVSFLNSLDVNFLNYLYDAHGVRVGFSMATAAGTGNLSREKAHKNIASVAADACLLFTNMAKDRPECLKPETLASTFQFIGDQSKNIKHVEAKSSLIGTVVTRDDSGLKVLLGNIGDGIVLIVNTRIQKIKYSLTGCTYKTPHTTSQDTTFEPFALQDLSSTPMLQRLGLQNSQDVVQAAAFDIEEGDIVIHMTHGAAKEFIEKYNISNMPGQNRAYKKPVFNLTALNNSIAAILKKQTKEKPISAYQIAQAIVAQILTLTEDGKNASVSAMIAPFEDVEYVRALIESPQHSAWLLPKIIELVKTDEELNSIITQLTNEKHIERTELKFLKAEKADDTVIGRRLCEVNEVTMKNTYTPDQLKLAHDKIVSYRRFNKILEPSAKDKTKVLDAADYVRTLIDNPRHSAWLLPKIIELVKTDDELKAIITQLTAEDVVSKNIYTPDQLELAHDKIVNYRHIDKISEVFANDKIGAQGKYRIEFDQCKEDLFGRIAIVTNAFAHSDVVDKHRNPKWDRLCGKTHTKSWAETCTAFGNHALQTLTTKAEKLQTKQDQYELWQWASEQELFNKNFSSRPLSKLIFWKTPKPLQEIQKHIKVLEADPEVVVNKLSK